MTEGASAEVGGELPRWVGLWKSKKQWSVISGQWRATAKDISAEDLVLLTTDHW